LERERKWIAPGRGNLLSRKRGKKETATSREKREGNFSGLYYRRADDAKKRGKRRRARNLPPERRGHQMPASLVGKGETAATGTTAAQETNRKVNSRFHSNEGVSGARKLLFRGRY